MPARGRRPAPLRLHAVRARGRERAPRRRGARRGPREARRRRRPRHVHGYLRTRLTPSWSDLHGRTWQGPFVSDQIRRLPARGAGRCLHTEGVHGREKAAHRACRVGVVVGRKPVRVRGRRRRHPVPAAGPGLRAGSGCCRPRRRQLRRRRVQVRPGRRLDPARRLRDGRGEGRAEGQGLQDRPGHRGLQHRCSAHEGAPGDHRPGGGRRRRRRERPQGREVRGQVRRRRPRPGRHGHPARRGLHGRGRPPRDPHDRALPLRRGVQQVHEARPGLQQLLHRPGAGAVLRRPRRRLLDAGQHGSLHRQPMRDAGRVHVPPSAGPPDRSLREPRGRATSSFASPPRPPPAAPRPASRPTRSPSGSARTSRRTSRASGPSSSRSTRIRPRPAPTSTRWPRRTRS